MGQRKKRTGIGCLAPNPSVILNSTPPLAPQSPPITKNCCLSHQSTSQVSHFSHPRCYLLARATPSLKWPLSHLPTSPLPSPSSAPHQSSPRDKHGSQTSPSPAPSPSFPSRSDSNTNLSRRPSGTPDPAPPTSSASYHCPIACALPSTRPRMRFPWVTTAPLSLTLQHECYQRGEAIRDQPRCLLSSPCFIFLKTGPLKLFLYGFVFCPV